MSRAVEETHPDVKQERPQCNGVEPHPEDDGGSSPSQDEIMDLAASALGTEIDKSANIKFQKDSVFAGRRDVRDPSTLQELQIISPRGTVRGYRNRVRAGIATFLEPISDKVNYREQEKGKIVVYTTSMCVVRSTWEKCKMVRNILQTHMIRYEERDLYMNKDNQRELRERLEEDLIDVPHVFADGVHLAGASAFQTLNETGELRNILENFSKINVRSSCGKCGGYRYVPCSVCHGSKKSLHRNHFTEEFHALRCMQCDESGLKRCHMCIDQQE